MTDVNGVEVEADESPALNELAAALAKAQGQMEGAKKDALNPHFRNRYADLASVWEACREALSSNGLAVVQMPGSAGGKDVMVTTLLLHSSGQFIRSRYVMPVSGPGPQGVGSALTYARRYALAAMVGVAPEDDDGNAAQGKSDTPARQAAPAEPVGQTGSRTAEVKSKLAKRIVDVREGESEREAEARVQSAAFEKIRALGAQHGLEGKRLSSFVKGAGISKTQPDSFNDADVVLIETALAALPKGAVAS